MIDLLFSLNISFGIYTAIKLRIKKTKIKRQHTKGVKKEKMNRDDLLKRFGQTEEKLEVKE